MVLVLVDFAIALLAKEAVAKRATNANNKESFFIFFNFKDLSNGNTPVQFDLLHLTLSFKEDCQNFKLSENNDSFILLGHLVRLFVVLY